jgi:hypothetical protein
MNISLPELEAILEAERERQYNQNRFAAALKGIDLDAGAAESAEERFEAVKAKALASLSGKSEEEYTLGELGLGIEEED